MDIIAYLLAKKYVEQHSDLSNYYTKNEIESFISNRIQNIDISDLSQSESIILYGGSASDVMEV